jgi:hypothetical protein
MRSRLLTLLSALSLALVVLPIAQAPAQETEPVGDTARAGVAVVDATWHVGSSAGQHATEGKDTNEVDPHSHAFKTRNSYGVQSRLSIRTIVVEGTSGDRVALVKTDNYLAQDLLQRRVGQLLEGGDSGVTYDNILLSASHNHSSPYHVTPAIGPWIFTDAFDLRMYEYQARQVANSIEEAAASMVPVKMGATTVQHSIFKGNVPGPATAEDGTPGGYPRKFGDYSVAIVRFDSLDPNDAMGTLNGTPVNKAVWVNYGQHPESLDGYDLITADYLGPLERFVDRETGAPLVLTQGDVGSAEGTGDEWRVNQDGTIEAWYHRGFANAERGARYLADSIVEGFNEIENGTPAVPYSTDFPVGMYSTWIPGPSSHPYPSFGNCRTERTVEGSPGAPTTPDCARPFPKPAQSQMVWENIKAHGLPVPEHYDTSGFMGVEENLRLRLQAVRLGDVILASCSCESQVDLILNFESRADDKLGNLWHGYEWKCSRPGYDPQAPATPDGPVHTWTCAEDDPQLPPNSTRTLQFNDYAYRRMLAQIYNDADGWDNYDNTVRAMAEPADLSKIWGNFTHEEMGGAGEAGAGTDVIPVDGYKIAVGMGHTGDYLGYTVSYREYMNRDHYRKALTSYGPHTADYMVTRLLWMAAELKDDLAGRNDFANPLETDPYYKLQAADEARQEVTARMLGQLSSESYDAWMAALPNDVGPAAALEQPKSIKRFDAARFTWRGGSNAIDNPTVVVQRNTENGWVDYAGQSGEVQTFLDFPNGVQGVADTYTGRQEWKWTANFEAFNFGPRRDIDPRGAQIPEGEYRFVVEGLIREGRSNVPYELTSDPFAVSKWDGIQVKNLTAEEDGTVSFKVSGVEGGTKYETPNQPNWPIRYPRTYTTPALIRFIRDDNRTTVCRSCSFRPWAIGSAVANAQVTVSESGEKIPATCDISGTCRTDRPIYTDERVLVDRGDVVDTYGEINGEASGEVQGTKERPTTSPSEDPGPEATILTFTGRSAGSAQYSDPALFEARLTDADGDPIEGVDVTFEMIGTEGPTDWTDTTDSDGVASVEAVMEDKPGSYSLIVRFAGNDDYTPSANSNSFVVAQEDTTTVLWVGDKRGPSRMLRARLTDRDSNAGISGRTLDFYESRSSDLIATAITGGDGWAQAEVGGKHKNARSYEARFEGDDYYLPSRS